MNKKISAVFLAGFIGAFVISGIIVNAQGTMGGVCGKSYSSVPTDNDKTACRQSGGKLELVMPKMQCPQGSQCNISQTWFCTCGRTDICGNGTCEMFETSVTCPEDCGQVDPSQFVCFADSECISDGGNCHHCFNKIWYNSTSYKSFYNCDGIGNSLCKCQNGKCVVDSICGDGVCDIAKGETAANCPQDCGQKINNAVGQSAILQAINSIRQQIVVLMQQLIQFLSQK